MDANAGPREGDRPPTIDAVEILHRRFIAGQPEMAELLEEARADTQVQRLVYDLRASAGLTQAALAARVGTTQSVISRLEDADYDGHSLALLRRIAAAVGREIRIEAVPIEAPAAAGAMPTEAGRRPAVSEPING